MAYSCVLPLRVCLKTWDSIGNGQFHIKIQTSSFFWKLGRASGTGPTSPCSRDLLWSVAAVSLPQARACQSAAVPATLLPWPRGHVHLLASLMYLTSWPLQPFDLERILHSPTFCDLLIHQWAELLLTTCCGHMEKQCRVGIKILAPGAQVPSWLWNILATTWTGYYSSLFSLQNGGSTIGSLGTKWIHASTFLDLCLAHCVCTVSAGHINAWEVWIHFNLRSQ